MKKFLIYLVIFILTATVAIIISAQVASAPAVFNLFTKTSPLPALELPKIETPKTVTTTLLFGGDVMLSRQVNQRSVKYQDWTWPFKKIASTTAAADLFVINLESPFTIGGNHLVKTGSFSFKADPESMAALTLAGVDVVALANNHTINQGRKGIADTQKLLQANGIVFTGAGLNEAQARAPAIKCLGTPSDSPFHKGGEKQSNTRQAEESPQGEKQIDAGKIEESPQNENQSNLPFAKGEEERSEGGVCFGFLSYAYPDDYSVASDSTFGIAGLDIAKMKADVQSLKNQVDLVIVMMHAGYEYTSKPNQQQQEFAKTAIDAGADLIIGHHPHWVQITEIYNNKPILYSLGNLVFDQMWSNETQQGALAQITLEDKTIKTIEIIPIIIKDYGQAELADQKTSEEIIKRMGLKDKTIIINK